MFIVNNDETFRRAMEFINHNEMLAYDIETTGLNPRKDKVIGFGVSNSLDGFYVPLQRWDTTAGKLFATSTLGNNLHIALLSALANKYLLMFNASFDARFTKYNFGIDLLPALHTDVLLLKHTIDSDFPFGLKEIATKLWGHDVKKEKEELQSSIKANQGTAKEYFKADTEILARYCVQDCLLTMRVYNYYRPMLKKEGLESFYYSDEVLPLYKTVTIPMEERGVAVDVPKMESTLQAISLDITILENSIQKSINPHISNWIYEYLDAEYPLVTPKGNKTKLAKEMEKYGFTDKFRAQAGAWRKDNPEMPSIFNLNSKHHLKDLFFSALKEKPLSKTPTGQPQVDDEFIQSMHSKYNWACSLTDYNRLQKLKSTYIERFLNESENGIFYPSFYQHRTTSGRFGSDLQQLPRPISGIDVVARYTNIIREFIIPRPEFKLVSADYTQLEPSIFAHTSNDQALQNIFINGQDFYSEVAIRTERLTQYSSDKAAANYLGKLAPEIRQRAKAYALGIAYGLTGYKLQFELEITQEQGERLVEAYLLGFPQLRSWMNESKDKAKFDGNIRAQLGRMRKMPAAVAIFKKYGQRIFDSLQLWKDYNQTPEVYEQAKKDRKTIINLCNSAINHQVQSTAASIVNKAGIRIVQVLNCKLLNAYPICQIHDEWLFEVPENELKEVIPLIKYEMENIVKLSVPLKTEPKSGSNFRECK